MKASALFLLFLHVAFATANLKTVYEWKYIDYQWESPEQKEEFIRNGDYDYKNIVPVDVEKAKDKRIFVSVTGDNGVPASLATVTKEVGPSGPLLKPYPDWTLIDKCNKLYALDTGYIGSRYACPAQVLVFDLGTNQLVNRITIPDSVSQNSEGVGKLVTPVLEAHGPECNLQNLFMADVNGRGLVIYNEKRESFRLESNVFEPEPRHSNVTIAGESFNVAYSLMGMALLPLAPIGENHLILRPFASKALHAARTWDLARSISGNSIEYKSNYDMLPSQATAMGSTNRDVLLFGLTQETAIGCWNPRRPMTKDSIVLVAQDEDRLQFISGLKVRPNTRPGAEEVWVVSNRLQKIKTGTINFDEINFRVLFADIDTVLPGKCE